MSGLTRRECLTLPALALARPQGVIVDSHIHLFDPERFPYHANAVYRPPAQTLQDYARFAAQAKIDHAVIVHPEPYQDDHRYLEYCFANEPSPGFFKGTCLFDPVDPATPARMKRLSEKLPGRIVALRIHENRKPGERPTTTGPIRDRDLASPAVAGCWAAARELGLAIQMHMIPYHAPQVEALAARFGGVPVILDHLARAGEGTPAEFASVLRLAELPRVYMKFSAVRYSSKEPFPHRDVKPIVRRAYDAFGPRRLLWGVLGMNMPEFEQSMTLFDEMLGFAPAAARARIRGLNAMELYSFA
jgi:predicted TIM-barrel fold metal-dependent hydrolase